MSRENMELVQRSIDAYNRRHLAALLEVFHPDADWYPLSALAEGDQAYHGHEGIKRWWANQQAAFEELRINVSDLRDVEDVVLVLGKLSTRSKSGVALDTEVGWFAEIRDGLLISGHAYPSHTEALEAVGLRE